MSITRIRVFPILLLWILPAGAQTSPVRDAAAVSAVQNAIAALGGTAALNQISDSTVQGSFQNSANPAASGTFTWQTAGVEFNYTTVTGGATRAVLSGHGVPADLENGASVPIWSQVVRALQPWHLPGLILLNELNNSNYSLTYVGQEVQNGTTVIHVQTSDTSDSIGTSVTPQDWYFDQSTYLPVSLSRRIPDVSNAIVYTMAFQSFGPFMQVNQVLVSSTFAVTTANGTKTFTVSSVVFNSGLPPSTFDPPGGVK
jgi:hypothetical protein